MVALAAGVAAGGLLAFGWWFGLMEHHQWVPILNPVVPIVGLAAVPAVLCARLPRLRLAIAYAIGSWSFVGWSLVAIAIDQLWKGIPISGLTLGIRSTLLYGAPLAALVIAVGLGVGGLLRRTIRWVRPKE